MPIARWLRKLFHENASTIPAAHGRRIHCPLRVEELEGRALLSTTSLITIAPAAATPALSTNAASPVSTTTVWASTATPTIYGQAATFTARVSAATGSAKPAGTVRFEEGTTVLGSASLDTSGNATLSITTLSAGNHNIIATYVSSGTFASSTSPELMQQVAPAHDLVVLQSSPPPQYTLSSGQDVTLTASVIGLTFGAGNPSGLVQFFDNGKSLGQPASVGTDGNANLTTNFQGAGSHQITANFLGDSHFGAGVSTPLTLHVSAVTKAASVTVVTTPAIPLVVGQQLSVTAQVRGVAAGSPVATGQVQFAVDGADVGGPSALDATGKITLSFSSLRVGSHTLTTTYLGDAHYATSSERLAVNVNATNRSATTASLTSSTTSMQLGGSLTLTAKVASNVADAIKPTGLLQLVVDGHDQGAPVGIDTAGTASVVFTPRQAGAHILTVRYLGDSLYSASVSNSVNLQVTTNQQLAPAVSVIASSKTPAPGQQIGVTAYIGGVGAHGAQPTGLVQLIVDGKNQGNPVAVSALGTASFRVAFSQIGSHTIAVAYAGDTHYLAKTSGTVSVQVAAAPLPSRSTLTVSTANSLFGDPINLTVSVTASTQGAAVPTGKVQLFDNGIAVGQPVALDATGKVVVKMSTLQVGSHSIKASYLGDGKLSSSLTGASTINVAPGPVGISLKSSAASVITGAQVILTAQISAGATLPIPTGKAQFLVNGIAWGTPVTIDGSGKAVLSTTFANAGTYSVAVEYLGDASFAAKTSAVVQQLVTQPVGTAADLSQLIAAWPDLPLSVRQAILALLNTTAL